MTKLITKLLSFLVVLLVFLLFSSFYVYSDGFSCSSHNFKGTCQFIKNSGTVNCSVSTTIAAYRNYATDTTEDTSAPTPYKTTYSGEYGNYIGKGDRGFSVTAPSSDNNGETINFTLNNVSADQTESFSCGTLSTVHLTITDTTFPQLVTISKANNSYLNNTDRLTIIVSDNKGINNQTFNNGNGSNVSFSNNTAFNPLFTSQGNNYIDIILTDKIGNINVSTYNYSFDNVTPRFTDIGPSGAQSTTASSLNVIAWVTINEIGNCTYGTANSSFGALSQMNSSNGLNHTANLTFSADASSTAYYFKCNDTLGNINNISKHKESPK